MFLVPCLSLDAEQRYDAAYSREGREARGKHDVAKMKSQVEKSILRQGHSTPANRGGLYVSSTGDKATASLDATL